MNKRLLMILSGLVAIGVIGGFVFRDTKIHLPMVVAEQPHTSQNMCEVNGFCQPTSSTLDTFSSSTLPTNADVLRVIDGDTIVVNIDHQEGEWTVRLLGVDTPESVDPRRPVQCFGKEASGAMAELLNHKRVRLEADVQADERDKYGRLLRNVYLENGMDVNAWLVRRGYAHAYLSFPLTPLRKRELSQLQATAREKSVGLWSPRTCAGKT